MKIAYLNAATSLINKEIETSVHSLLFDLSFDNVLLVDTMQNALNMLQTALGSASINLSRENGSETQTLFAKIPLFQLAEMSANNGGVIRIDADGAKVRIRFSIELSNDGSFRLNDDAKIILNIENIPPARDLSIYALDLPSDATSILQYEKKFLNANVEKDLDTTFSDVFACNIDQLDLIKLYYNNGKMVTLLRDELKVQLLHSQDPILVADGKTYYGYANMATVNVQDCWKISATLNTSETVYIIKTVNI